MTEYYDPLETRAPEARSAALFAELRSLLHHAKAHAPYYRDLLRDVEPDGITGPEALANLPLTRKSDLIELQGRQPPLAGLNARPAGDLVRIFQSPGPIYDVQGSGSDPWRSARALFAAGIRRHDVIHVAFSYHLTPAAAIIEEGAKALGCTVFAAGTGNTELQVRAIAHVKPRAYAGTPSFLKILLSKGREMGLDLTSLTQASVGAEALPPSLRAELKAEGVHVLQWYGTAELGIVAYESAADEGLIVEEGAIVEIVRPGTGDPVPEGEVGELVVTLPSSRDYPLIRFATGDLSAVLAGRSACGRTNIRLRGWLGRADQSTKVKDMFVHPSQVADVLKRHPEVRRARLVVTRDGSGQDVMTLHCETEAAVAPAIAETVLAVCKLKALVELTAPGTLPADGKVIEDLRQMV
jgi:phenylacetate-CoA ligase